ncbi:MAG: lysophospholipid acyltransferase family protein [Endomicrobium sp.]|jgi:KDO2-lipid IV(A) lauroyltransferase|nr:lysophospholipid acyltransferase family protein [Endomicrobium sp.]
MSKRTSFQNYAEYFTLNIVIFFIRLFPLKFSVKISQYIAVFVYHFIPIRKKHVLEMLSISFPENSQKEIELIAKNTYKNFMRTVVEIIFFPIMSNEEINKLLVCTNEHLAEKSYAAGRGTILMSAHFGNWELTALAFSKRYPMSVVVAEQSNKLVDNMMNDIRTRQGFHTISRDGMAFKGALKALKRNEFVAILSDQDAGRQGVFVPFLGRLTATPKGAALFALRVKCPIIIALGVRQNDGVMEVEFTEIPMPNTGNEERDIEIINTFYSQKLEDAVRKNPEQWFWFHRKWNTRP